YGLLINIAVIARPRASVTSRRLYITVGQIQQRTPIPDESDRQRLKSIVVGGGLRRSISQDLCFDTSKRCVLNVALNFRTGYIGRIRQSAIDNFPGPSRDVVTVVDLALGGIPHSDEVVGGIVIIGKGGKETERVDRRSDVPAQSVVRVARARENRVCGI